MTDVFISYKRRLRPRVEQIAKALSDLQLTVWFDAAIEPGGSFPGEISREVRSAKCVLVCWSNDAFPHGGDQNGWVLGEATIGRDRKVLIAAQLEPTELDPPWNMVHAKDLVAWTPELPDPERRSWRNILSAIGRHVGRPGLADYDEALFGEMPAAALRWARAYPDDPLALGGYIDPAAGGSGHANNTRSYDQQLTDALSGALSAPSTQETVQPTGSQPPQPAAAPPAAVGVPLVPYAKVAYDYVERPPDTPYPHGETAVAILLPLAVALAIAATGYGEDYFWPNSSALFIAPFLSQIWLAVRAAEQRRLPGLEGLTYLYFKELGLPGSGVAAIVLVGAALLTSFMTIGFAVPMVFFAFPAWWGCLGVASLVAWLWKRTTRSR